MSFKLIADRPSPPTTGAVLSPCGRFRYSLWRAWGERRENGMPVRHVNFIMLNPSTADASQDDPTIRRCIGFAKSWDYDGIAVTNLYPLRATDPRELRKAEDRLGPRQSGPPMEGMPTNDVWIGVHVALAEVVVCAWGGHGTTERAGFVLKCCRDINVTPYHMGLTRGGQPKHPLYLPADTPPTSF